MDKKNARKFFHARGGYATMKALKAASVHTSLISRMLAEGEIVKIKAGLYRLADMPYHLHQGMIEACLVMPKAVVCLHSALSFYELTTQVPAEIMVALPRETKPKAFSYPPVRVFFFSGAFYMEGIEIIDTGKGIIRLYVREKSIMDAFRLRNRLGLEVALEALSEYMRKYPGNLGRLVDWSKRSRIFSIVRPYLEIYAA